MKNIPNQYANHFTMSGMNALESLIGDHPSVFDPTNEYQLIELQDAMIQLYNYFDDLWDMNEDERARLEYAKLMIHIYNYFDENYQPQTT